MLTCSTGYLWEPAVHRPWSCYHLAAQGTSQDALVPAFSTVIQSLFLGYKLTRRQSSYCDIVDILLWHQLGCKGRNQILLGDRSHYQPLCLQFFQEHVVKMAYETGYHKLTVVNNLVVLSSNQAQQFSSQQNGAYICCPWGTALVYASSAQ